MSKIIDDYEDYNDEAFWLLEETFPFEEAYPELKRQEVE